MAMNAVVRTCIINKFFTLALLPGASTLKLIWLNYIYSFLLFKLSEPQLLPKRRYFSPQVDKFKKG